MNQENRVRSRYSHAGAQLRKLRDCNDEASVAQKAAHKKTVDELAPMVRHFDQDIAQVKRWRADKKKRLLWEWVLQLIILSKTLRSVKNPNSEFVAIDGLDIKDLNRAMPGFFGSCAKTFLKEQKLGHVDPAGALYINLRKLPPDVLEKARVERDKNVGQKRRMIAQNKRP